MGTVAEEAVKNAVERLVLAVVADVALQHLLSGGRGRFVSGIRMSFRYVIIVAYDSKVWLW